MNGNPQRLIWLLRLGGAVMLTALGAVVMPFEWMDAIHRQLGLGALPRVPIVGYLTRSISALYALHGALLIFLAGDVRRYLPAVRFLAVAGALFGGLMLGIDYAVEMPLPWTLIEGPWVVALSAVILWLTMSGNFPPPPPGDPPSPELPERRALDSAADSNPRGRPGNAGLMRFVGLLLMTLLAAVACSRTPAKVSVTNGSRVVINKVWVNGDKWTQPLGWMLPGMSVRIALPSGQETKIWMSFEAGGQKYDSRGPGQSNYFQAGSMSPLSLTVSPDLKVLATNQTENR